MPKPSHVLTLPTLHPHAAELRDAILNKLTYSCSKTPSNAGPYDWYLATVLAVRDRMVDRWLESEQRTERKHGKRVYYLSIEFLIGRLLFDSLINLRLLGTARAALASLDVDLDQLRKLEPDAALGNGGLGRLAACYMDSMAALGGAGLRLRHPLRARPVHAADPGRLAARAAGALARVRQSVGVRAARNRIFHPLRRQRRICRRRLGRHGARPLVSRRARARGGARYADRRMARPARQHAAAVVRALDHAGASRGLQRGRCRRRDRAPRPGRGDFARALSERRHACGPGAAAAAGVFLHLGVAAGHRPAPSAAIRRPGRRCRSMSPSSSTTRIRPSPSPS